jgi:DNA-binding MarR family transcriptional regulator
MRDTYDPRWDDDRRDVASDGRDLSRGSRGATDPRETEPVGARDVFSRGLKLPRGPERTGVRARDRRYELRGSETRTLSTVGAFRVVRASDLRDHLDRPADPRQGELRRLRESGLIRTSPLDGHRDHVVVLTDRGRELLEGHRDPSYEARQTFYAGVRKPRELEHDHSSIGRTCAPQRRWRRETLASIACSWTMS